MRLFVAGCHGGETLRHKTSAFVLDGTLAIDAGALTSGLELRAQAKLKAVLVSHAHLDHVRDLATLADNRCQLACKPLVIGGTKETLDTLKLHFFNNRLWPDFSKISTSSGPVIVFEELEIEVPKIIAGKTIRAVTVTHTIDAAGFVIEGETGALAYSGDTGPTDHFWEVLATVPNLKTLLMEVSFPNRESGIAKVSGHHTPQSLAADLKKLETLPGIRPDALPTLLFHMKPVFQKAVETECAALKGLSLEVAQLDDQFSF